MTVERARCAAIALGDHAELSGLTVDDLLACQRGQASHGGWYIRWSWVMSDNGAPILEILREHRMAGLSASRVYADGTIEPIEVPDEFRPIGETPEDDLRLERERVAQNCRADADLKRRGLLPTPT